MRWARRALGTGDEPLPLPVPSSVGKFGAGNNADIFSVENTAQSSGEGPVSLPRDGSLHSSAADRRRCRALQIKLHTLYLPIWPILAESLFHGILEIAMDCRDVRSGVMPAWPRESPGCAVTPRRPPLAAAGVSSALSTAAPGRWDTLPPGDGTWCSHSRSLCCGT